MLHFVQEVSDLSERGVLALNFWARLALERSEGTPRLSGRDYRKIKSKTISRYYKSASLFLKIK
jgi:hypothetical protein